MKKIISLTVASILVLSNFSISNAKLETSEIFYWKITWIKRVEENRTIFLVEKEDWEIDQIFSSALAPTIKEMYKNSENVVIEWQKYYTEKNSIYLWFFVNNIWIKSEYDTIQTRIALENIQYANLSKEEKIQAYLYLESKKSEWIKESEALKYLEKYYWWVIIVDDIKKQKSSIALILNDIFRNKDVCWIKNWKTSFDSYSEDFQEKIKWIKLDKLIQIIKWENKEWEILYIYNNLNLEPEIYDYLKNKEDFKSFQDLPLTEKEEKEFLLLTKLFKEKKDQSREYLKAKNTIKALSKIENTEENQELLKAGFYHQLIHWEYDLKEFNCEENSSKQDWLKALLEKTEEDIISETFSKDFKEYKLKWMDIKTPHNFSIQTIKLENWEYNQAYYTDFYSEKLALNINFVENFDNNNCKEIADVKTWWIYWKKYLCENGFVYKLESWNQKIEIFYQETTKDFSYIFDEIIKTIKIK